MSKRRRSHRPRTLVLPWEERAPAFAWFSRRRLGRVLMFLCGCALLYTLVSLDDRRRKINATRAAIRSVMLATEAFRADHGRCPVHMEELVRPTEIAGVTGRYLLEIRRDGWGRPLQLRCPGGKHPSSVDVLSEGPPSDLFPSEPIE
jgi:hypothetical protein